MRRGRFAVALMVTLVGCTGHIVLVAPAPQPSPGVGCGEFPKPGRVTFEDRNGTCVPSSQLELVQCDLNQPPVLVRGLGTGRVSRSLGGAYRIPVKALPDGARLLGTQRGTDIYGLPSDPSWIWVDDGAEITRWLALPDQAPWTGRAPSAFFIGDSITDGAEPFIQTALPDWTLGFDAVVGRGSADGISPAEAQAAAVPPPDVVVVELGTNDAAPDVFRQNAEQIADTLKTEPLLVWQTVHSPSETVPEINGSIHHVMGTLPNTAVADWYSFATDDILVSDGVHPQSEHEGAMADLLAPLLRTWRDAVEGLGPSSCIGN